MDTISCLMCGEVDIEKTSNNRKHCNLCVIKRKANSDRKYYMKNIENIKNKTAEYQRNNPEKTKLWKKQYEIRNKIVLSEEERYLKEIVRREKISISLKEKHKRGEIMNTKSRLGKRLSEEHRKKISESRKKLHLLRGYINSEETRNKISLTQKGKKLSEDSIKKLKRTWNKSDMIEFARERRAKQIFPIKDTSIEVKVQNFLKELKIDFFTHQYIKEIEHGYQCDILIPTMNLIIECDGDYWHKYPIGKELDHIRTKELIEKGFKVLRLWEFEINQMSVDKFRDKLGGI